MEANSTISVWPIVIGSLVFIGMAGFCVYLYIQNIQKKNRERKEEIERREKELKEKVIQASQIGTQKANIAGLFSLYLKHFSGTMNSLYDIINDSSELYIAKINFDNLEQTIAARNNEELKKWFSVFTKDRNTWDIVLYKDKATEIINILMECGISAHNEKEITWSNESTKKYYKPTPVQLGQKCIVEAPYWIYNGEIFEKGLVIVK